SNLGTVVGYGQFASAVYLAAGGTVTNGSSVNSTALISATGDGEGVLITGSLGTVTNFGTIQQLIGPFNVRAFAVYLNAGGTVTNNAGGVIQGAADGVILFGTGGVTNAGSIGGGDRGVYVSLTTGG